MYEIKVSGMTCGSCASTIEHVLKKIDASAEITINLKDQLIQVRSNQEESAISRLIQEAGFQVLESRKVF